jgi:flagellum-specific peptidoglycan hydrolase FlgJ
MALLDNLAGVFQPGGAFGSDEFDQKLMNYLLARARPNSQQQQGREIQLGNILDSLGEIPSVPKEVDAPASFDFNNSKYQSTSSGFTPNTNTIPSVTTATQNAQQSAPTLTSQQAMTMDIMRQAAAKVYPDNPMMQQVALSQAMLESGINFNSGLARQNNFFGIKAKKGSGAQMNTIEYENGVPVKQAATFATNETPHQSFEQHRRLIFDAPRYDPVEAAKTPEEAFAQLQRAGYATDPRYAAKLKRIYQRHVAPLYQKS